MVSCLNMENELRLRIFWIALAIGGASFLLEIAWIISVWLEAKTPGTPAGASRWKKFQAVVIHLLRLIFSRKIGSLLRTLIADGLVHRKLARKNKRRWGAHMLVLGSWLALGSFSTITGFVVEILPKFGLETTQIVAIPVLGQLFHADVWWVSFVNEALGLLLLAGMGLILYRRYVQRDPQLRTSQADTMLLILLTFIPLSGFPTETFRLLADYTTAAGLFTPSPAMLPPESFPAALYPVWGPKWAVLGYQTARLLGILHLGPQFWRILHNISFWIHIASCAVLLYTIPFSRFFHAFMSPLVVVLNTYRDQERLTRHTGVKR